MLLAAKTAADVATTFPGWMWIVFGGMSLALILGLAQMIMTHRERVEQIRHGQVPPKEAE